MATQQGMSGVDVFAMLAELQALLPLWIGKIYQYDPKTLGIRLNGEDKAKYFFIAEAGRRANLTGTLPPAPPNPSGFSMFLRKYISGGRVLEIRQYGFQRIFRLSIGKKDTVFHLIFELFDEGNVILCDENETIIKPLWHHRFRDREVVPGVQYLVPGSLLLTAADFTRIFQTSEKDVVRTLAVDCMLGGRYAEEICMRADIRKDLASRDADSGRLYQEYLALLSAVVEEKQPVITGSGCWPILLGGESPLSTFATYNTALDAFYPSRRHERKEEKIHLSREDLIRKQQQEAIKKFERKIGEIETKIEALYANYPLVSEVIRTLDNASREKSWQDIEKTVKASDHPIAGMIISVHPAEAAIELALDGRVKIYVHESIEANIGRYYDQIKKFRRKREGAIAALSRRPAGEKKKTRTFRTLKPRWFHRFRWSYTSDGVLLLGGRDAAQNEELVKRYMEGGDTFVHADVHGASVVLVKGTTGRMDEVAQFAASYSNAWKSGHFSADVYAVRPEQVSKTPESGEYVARGAFIVRGERQYFRNVPLSIAIGIQLEPEAAVIGGPPASVQHRAEKWVLLSPGQFNPNDITKKVLRTLREMLSEEEKKALRQILTTETVAAFVPPGGSDITDHHES